MGKNAFVTALALLAAILLPACSPAADGTADAADPLVIGADIGFAGRDSDGFVTLKA